MRKYLVLLLLLVCGTMPVVAQVSSDQRYTLTDGTAWTYFGNSWNQSDWDNERNMVRNSFYRIDMENSAELKPWPETSTTRITKIGEHFVRLNLDDPSNPTIEVVDHFDERCAWSRTGTTGSYYQFVDGYYYYLIREGLKLVVKKYVEGALIDNVTTWYSWDFGAGLQQKTFHDNGYSMVYHWMTIQKETSESAFDATTLSCTSYERPDAPVFPNRARTDYDVNKTFSANLQDFNSEITYFCEDVQDKYYYAAVQNMQVNMEYFDRQLGSIPAGLGLTALEARTDRADAGTVSSVMRFNQDLALVPTVVETEDLSAGIKVTPAYTLYSVETFRYGISTDWNKMYTGDGWDMSGYSLNPENHYYYADNGSSEITDHTSAPTAQNTTLKVDYVTFMLSNSSRRYLQLKTDGGTPITREDHLTLAEAQTVKVACTDVPPRGATATVTMKVYYQNGTTQEKSITLTMDATVDSKPMPEPVHAPVVQGYVVGGGRMAKVTGNTHVTVASCDTIYAIYGGNDIAGWVQGEEGATIQIGTAQTDATHPVNVGYVYGGGCGLYTYQGINKANINGENVDPYLYHDTVTNLDYQAYYFNGKVYPWNTLPENYTGTSADDWSALTPVTDHVFSYTPVVGDPSQVDNDETGDGGDGTVPYVKTAHIIVGVNAETLRPDNYASLSDAEKASADATADAQARTHNDYIVIDSLFGGAENSFIGIDATAGGGSYTANQDPVRAITIDVYGGTIFTAFGGNNYGGSVANTALVMVNVHNTKLVDAMTGSSDEQFFSGFGREYGIRYLFGGGNLVDGSHSSVLVRGGMIDTCFLGGNQATVKTPIGFVNCQQGERNSFGYLGNFIMTNMAYNTSGTTDDRTGTNISNPTYPNPKHSDLASGPLQANGEPVAYLYDAANPGAGFGPSSDAAHHPFQVERGEYNIRCLFGGNNRATMDATAQINLLSGGIGAVYGGGNAGDMTSSTSLSTQAYRDMMLRALDMNTDVTGVSNMPYPLDGEGQPKGISSIVYSPKNSRIVCDYIFGGCRMANVAYSCGVYLAGGIFGFVNGGNDISGDVGSEKGSTNERYGAYSVIDSSCLVIGDVVGGSDGYYHCDDNQGKYDDYSLREIYTDATADPYDEFVGFIMPTHNNVHLAMKNGLVMGKMVSGGIHANVGFPEETGTGTRFRNRIKDNETGTERKIVLSSGVQNGSIYLRMTGGTVMGNVIGGGYMSSIYGLSYLEVGGTTRIKGSLYAGNDLMGSVKSFGAYASETQTEATYAASNGTRLNMQEGASYNAIYSTYLKIVGTPFINNVYGSGNGAYDYESPDLSICSTRGEVERPLQKSVFVDINTWGGFIDTVFGGGNGVGVEENVMVLLNNKTSVSDVTPPTFNDDVPSAYPYGGAFVGTIFGGNNRENMTTCVPDIVLQQGVVRNVFGGGNSGNMGHSRSFQDVCGQTVDNVSTHIKLNSSDAHVTDTVFGGCRMANVENMAYIEVLNGEVNNLYGGNDISGRINGNTRIDVSGGTVNHIYGGSNGRYDYDALAGNRYNVYAYGQTHDAAHLVAASIDGERPFVDSTTVNLYGGTINADVFGGGAMGDCRSTLVVVNDRVCPGKLTPDQLTINGSIFGGGEGDYENLHAERHGNVMPDGDLDGACYVELRHANNLSSAKAYGGGKGGDVYNTYITAYSTWDKPFKEIYGGCWGSDVFGVTNVVMEGSSVEGAVTAENVFGGNDFTGNIYQTNILVKNGTYGNIYGGGNGDYEEDVYSDGNYSGVFPEGHSHAGTPRSLAVPNNERAVVNFENGTVDGNLYGGGKLGTTWYLQRNPDKSYKSDGGARKLLDIEKHEDPTQYAYIIVNVKNGTFNNNIYAGGKGADKGKQIVYGLKELNMEDGTVKVSLYGGSENVDDGYPYEQVEDPTAETKVVKADATRRPSSVLNLTGGNVKGFVYGGGYLGAVYGSSYVNIGTTAVDNCVLWDTTIDGRANAYEAFKPGYVGGYAPALSANRMLVQQSIYGGANWGDNPGSGDFNKDGYFGGVTHVRVDGEGYNTMGTEQSLPIMNIGNSIIGAGTSAGGGDIYTRIDLRNYGSINVDCHPSRSLRAIQRADALWLENTAVKYTGSTDAISANLSVNYTLNRLDTINCVGYNIVELDATATNIYRVNYLHTEDYSSTLGGLTADNAYGNPLTFRYTDNNDMEVGAICDDLSSMCDKLSSIDPNVAGKQLTAMVIENGINVDFSNGSDYGAIMGYAYLLAEKGTNAQITARAKYDGVAGSVDGGFITNCSDSLQVATDLSTAAVTWERQSGNVNAEYPYTNYSNKYRTWSLGKGVSKRYAVILAHSDPNALEENKIITLHQPEGDKTYNLSIARATMDLPSTNPGHYYKLETGVTISDENSEMRLVDFAYRPTPTCGSTPTQEWDNLEDQWGISPGRAKAYAASDETDGTLEDASHGVVKKLLFEGTAIGFDEIYDAGDSRQYFGLMMSSGKNFSVGCDTASRDGIVLSANTHTNVGSSFISAPVGDEANTLPQLNFYMLYNNNFSHTLVGQVTFNLQEYDENDQPVGGVIQCEVTITTILGEFQDMKYEVLAMYNEGRYDEFQRKVIFPATLQHRELYLEKVSWMPTDISTEDHKGNGDTLRSASQPSNHFYLTNDKSLIKNQEEGQHSIFGMSVHAMDNVSNTLVTSVGWHSIAMNTPQNLYTLAMGEGTGTKTRSVVDSKYYQPEDISLTPADTIPQKSLVSTINPYGILVGELDGRGDAALNVTLDFDGGRYYEDHGGKGYVGKVVLHMVSYTGGQHDDAQRFKIEIFVKTRDKGDTIFIASADSVVRAGITLHKCPETKLLEPEYKPGKSPERYVTSFHDAFVYCFEEGDIIAVIDTVNVKESVLIKGEPYMPVQVIRYTGTNDQFPGEKCVYRGPMINVSGDTAVFTARCIDFQGGMLGKIRPVDPTWNSATDISGDSWNKPAGDEATNYSNADTYPVAYDFLNKKLDVKCLDTNAAYGPVIAVKNEGVVLLQNGVTLRENYNTYTGSNSADKGAISVTDNGILRMINNVEIFHNISDETGYTALQPINGAVYVDGGTMELLESNTNTAVIIEENFLNRDGVAFNMRLDTDGKLRYTAFDTNNYNIDENLRPTTGNTLANVLLTRTEDVDDMTDLSSDAILFSATLAEATRVGVSKWFPGPTVRDTIQIAYQPSATYLLEAVQNNNFTSDNPDYFVFYNYGVNTQRVYLGRCATFRYQTASTDTWFTVDGVNYTKGDAISYQWLRNASCPTGGDTLITRAQGGFFPYTYTWTDVSDPANPVVASTRTSSYTNNQINAQIDGDDYKGFKNAIADTLYTSNVAMGYDRNEETLIYHSTVSDITGYCTLVKNVKVKLLKTDATGFTYGPVVTDRVAPEVNDQYYPASGTDEQKGLAAWTDVEHSLPSADASIVGDTARGVRSYKGVRITPMVWSPGSGTIIAQVLSGTNKSDQIYLGTDETHPINDLSFCEGDSIRLSTTPRYEDVPDVTNPEYDAVTNPLTTRKYTSRFLMWDFDPFYNNPAVYVVPPRDATVVAHFAPVKYWKDVVNSTAVAGAVVHNDYDYEARPAGAGYVTTYHGDVHIYNENGLAWLISVINGYNGQQIRPMYFNRVYIHEKEDGTPYDMKDYLWTPVGTQQYGFRGRIVGVGSADTTTAPQSVVIRNVVIDEPNMANVGFFGRLDTSIVENLTLEGLFARGSQYVGGLAANSTHSVFKNCDVHTNLEPDTVTVPNDAAVATSILVTRYVSGGLVGKSELDNIQNATVAAKFVGSAVFCGGMVGYAEGTTVANSATINTSRLTGLYVGGLAGKMVYHQNPRPNGFFRRLFGGKSEPSSSLLANNYVRMLNEGRTQRVAGLVGQSENAVIENNYVYGNLGVNSPAVALVYSMGDGTELRNNYYVSGLASSAVDEVAEDATLGTTATFRGHGNAVTLSEPVNGVRNLTRALNRWVRNQNALGGNYRTWRSDLTAVNSGYPVFGTPDLIPVSDTLVVNGCEQVEWEGNVYDHDAELTRSYIDTIEMIDSTLTTFIRLHTGSHTNLVDSAFIGEDYNANGFYLSAAETRLLLSSLDSNGHATLVLADTLQTSFGCDSTVTLTLTFSSQGGVIDVTPTAPTVKVYPNPTTSYVNIEAKGMTHIEVYDNEGRVLQRRDADDTAYITIDLTPYVSGIYYVRVHTPNTVTIQKIIKR